MSEWQLIWLPEALLDLSEHFEFLKAKNPNAAGQAAQAIRDVGFSLMKSPCRGMLLADGSGRRKLRVAFGKFGYVMHYLVEDDRILIVPTMVVGRQYRSNSRANQVGVLGRVICG